MVNDINKMLKVVASATENLEDKISDCLDNADICIDIENIDYESCVIIIKNIEPYEPCKRAIINYHKLSDYINMLYVNDDNSTYEKDFNNLSDALEDIKEFLNKKEEI